MRFRIKFVIGILLLHLLSFLGIFHIWVNICFSMWKSIFLIVAKVVGGEYTIGGYRLYILYPALFHNRTDNEDPEIGFVWLCLGLYWL